MKTELPSSSMPDGVIYFTVTDYNLSGRRTKEELQLVKECPNCGRVLGLLEFLVKQAFKTIGKFRYSVLMEDEKNGWCRDCYPIKQDFFIYRGIMPPKTTPVVMMRVWELRGMTGQPIQLFDPTVKDHGPNKFKTGWERIRNRGIRLMDGTVDHLNLQPQSNRSIDPATKKVRSKKRKP